MHFTMLEFSFIVVAILELKPPKTVESVFFEVSSVLISVRKRHATVAFFKVFYESAFKKGSLLLSLSLNFVNSIAVLQTIFEEA